MTQGVAPRGIWHRRHTGWRFLAFPADFSGPFKVHGDQANLDHWRVVNASGQQIETFNAGRTWSVRTLSKWSR